MGKSRVEGSPEAPLKFFWHDREAPYLGKSRVAACFGITCQAVINLTVSYLLPRQGVMRDILGNPMWRPFSVLPARGFYQAVLPARQYAVRTRTD